MNVGRSGFILLVVDSLRADHSDILLNYAKMYRRNFRYHSGIAPASNTIQSHASLFTGLPPCIHGVHERRDSKLLSYAYIPSNLRERLLHLRLSTLQYKSMLMSANPFVSPMFGYVGFNMYFDLWTSDRRRSFISKSEKIFLETLSSTIPSKKQRIAYLFRHAKFDLLLKMLLEKIPAPKHWSNDMWPRDKGGTKLVRIFEHLAKKAPSLITSSFIFINIMEVHEPYIRDDNFTKNQREILLHNKLLNADMVKLWRRAYKRQVYQAAKVLHEILDILEDSKLIDDLTIIITSDHGQLLGEHGFIGHGIFLFDELLRIPIFIRLPTYVDDVNLSEVVECNMNNICMISLLDLYYIVLEIATHNRLPKLCRDAAFAESYVVYEPRAPPHEKIRVVEKPLIAVYSNGYKLVYNSNNDNVVYLSKINNGDKPINDPDLEKVMLRKIKNYLRNCAFVQKLEKLRRKLRS